MFENATKVYEVTAADQSRPQSCFVPAKNNLTVRFLHRLFISFHDAFHDITEAPT